MRAYNSRGAESQMPGVMTLRQGLKGEDDMRKGEEDMSPSDVPKKTRRHKRKEFQGKRGGGKRRREVRKGN